MATAVADRSGVDQDAAAWAHLRELGERARRDRAGALTELRERFAAGLPSAGLQGPTEGRFVAFTLQPTLDRALAALAERWMPWSGKRFDACAQHGDNLLLGRRHSGFAFATRVEASALEPGTDVLVIDYGAVAASRRRGLGRVRDELVEVAPGTHLGQALWRGSGGRHARIAWWALRAS